MGKTNELLRQMIENPSEEMLRPVRKTVLLPQPDGSFVRRVTDKAGNVTEDTIRAGLRLFEERELKATLRCALVEGEKSGPASYFLQGIMDGLDQEDRCSD